jgi:hypothetical protein
VKLKLLLIISVLICVVGCKGENMKVDLSELKAVPQEKWEQLSRKRIYFAHQSIGYNIVSGLESIKDHVPQMQLNIVETKDFDSIMSGAFMHSSIGRNCDPVSKFEDFEKVMSKADNIDIALLKLCYIDIDETTDLKEIFDKYVYTYDNLEKKHPNVKFIHMTVPLRISSAPWKNFIKTIIGKPLSEQQINIKRNQFNQMIIEKYGSTGLVFDIAGFESTYPSGRKQTFSSKGEKYLSLVPAYTDDGGHLNPLGKKIIASEMLKFLLKM